MANWGEMTMNLITAGVVAFFGSKAITEIIRGRNKNKEISLRQLATEAEMAVKYISELENFAFECEQKRFHNNNEFENSWEPTRRYISTLPPLEKINLLFKDATPPPTILYSFLGLQKNYSMVGVNANIAFYYEAGCTNSESEYTYYDKMFAFIGFFACQEATRLRKYYGINLSNSLFYQTHQSLKKGAKAYRKQYPVSVFDRISCVLRQKTRRLSFGMDDYYQRGRDRVKSFFQKK